MKREDFVDYFAVRDEHLAIHQRLEEWARWVKPRPHGWHVAPMFRQYRSKAWQWERPEPRAAVDSLKALEIERVVAQLPEKHRDAIRWAYVWQGGPLTMARRLAVSKQGLAELIHAARTMVGNRAA